MLARSMETPFSLKPVWFIFAIFVAVLLFFNTSSKNNFQSSRGLRASSQGTPAFQQQQPLDFDIESSDALSEQQCTEFFPDLYHDIDRAIAYWKDRNHIISSKDVEIQSWRQPSEDAGGGALRILIHENELRVIEVLGTMGHLGYRGRGIGALNLIQRAVDSASAGGEKLPTIEVSLVLQDNSDPPGGEDDTHTFWSVATNKENAEHQKIWLFPNFDFWYAYPMGSYRDARRRAFQYDSPFFNKIPKVVWRGMGWVNWGIRGTLVNLTAEKDWADTKVVDWGGADNPDGIPVEQMCKYAFTAHTEGISYSGRLKYLLACDSVPIVHKLEWNVYYSHLLVSEGPDQNHISVERDWSDLESKVKHYLENPKEAEKVIENSLNTFRRRYLTRAAQSCYIRKLIRGYSEVSQKPETEQKTEKGDFIARRGFSFERFMDSPQDRMYETELANA